MPSSEEYFAGIVTTTSPQIRATTSLPNFEGIRRDRAESSEPSGAGTSTSGQTPHFFNQLKVRPCPASPNKLMKNFLQVEKKEFNKTKDEEQIESEKVKFTTNNEESSIIIDEDIVADETESRPVSSRHNLVQTPNSENYGSGFFAEVQSSQGNNLAATARTQKHVENNTPPVTLR